MNEKKKTRWKLMVNNDRLRPPYMQAEIWISQLTSPDCLFANGVLTTSKQSLDCIPPYPDTTPKHGVPGWHCSIENGMIKMLLSLGPEQAKDWIFWKGGNTSSTTKKKRKTFCFVSIQTA